MDLMQSSLNLHQPLFSVSTSLIYINSKLCHTTCFQVSFGLSFLAPYRKYWLACSVPGVMAFVLWHGTLFIPGRPLIPPDTTDLFTVASFNIMQSAGTVLDEDTRVAIENLDADLVGIQEVGKDVPLSEIDGIFPYQVQHAGIAVISRVPLADERLITVEKTDGKGQPVALRVTAEINDHQISVYVAQLVRPTISVRPMEYDARDLKRGMEALLDALRKDPNPVILLCDCNFSPTSESYENMAKLLNDSWRAAGFGLGLTAPASKNDVPFRVIRCDYIWHSSELATLNAKVIANHGASDHHPARAELGWIVDD